MTTSSINMSQEHCRMLASRLAGYYGLERVGHDQFKYGDVVVYYYPVVTMLDGTELVIFMVEGYGRFQDSDDDGSHNLGLLLACQIGRHQSKCLWRLAQYLDHISEGLDWSKADLVDNSTGVRL